MRLTDVRTGEIIVERDPIHAGIELQIGTIETKDGRIVRLTREEARRLAGLILFQAARLENPAASWAPSVVEAVHPRAFEEEPAREMAGVAFGAPQGRH